MCVRQLTILQMHRCSVVPKKFRKPSIRKIRLSSLLDLGNKSLMNYTNLGGHEYVSDGHFITLMWSLAYLDAYL